MNAVAITNQESAHRILDIGAESHPHPHAHGLAGFHHLDAPLSSVKQLDSQNFGAAVTVPKSVVKRSGLLSGKRVRIGFIRRGCCLIVIVFARHDQFLIMIKNVRGFSV